MSCCRFGEADVYAENFPRETCKRSESKKDREDSTE